MPGKAPADVPSGQPLMVDTEPTKGNMCTLLSHADLIFVDQVGPLQFVATNVITAEQHSLTPGDWDIEHDDDSGESVIFRTDLDVDDPAVGDDAMIETCDLFVKELFNHMDGDLFITESHSTPRSFTVQQTRMRKADVFMTIGVHGGDHTLTLAVFRVARAIQQRIFWGMSQFYALLVMTTYKGSKSTWVAKQRHKW